MREVPCKRWFVVTVVWITALLTNNLACGQITILLRDFSQPEAPASGYDEEGVRLNNGELITWDRIVQATVDPGDQERVNGWLRSIGMPAAKLRWRLSIGDVAGARRAAADLPESARTRSGPIALLVRLAKMSDALDHGNSIEAAAEWISVVEMLREHPTWKKQIPDSIEIPDQPEVVLHPRIIPHWESKTKAQEIWPTVAPLAADGSARPLAPTSIVYLTAIAIAAEQFDQAVACIERLVDPKESSDDWVEALTWYLGVRQGGAEFDEFAIREEIADWPEEIQAITTFWLASRGLGSSDKAEFERSALFALSVPARHQARFPELSATVVDLVARRAAEFGDEDTSRKLYKEIETHYRQTDVARRRIQSLERAHESANAPTSPPGN